MNTLEVCCGSLTSALAAIEGGAQRIELCSALSLDGLTPSIGLLCELRSLFPHLRIHVLIRPREGGFVYSEAEIRVMERDIHEAVAAGATAIVSGALNTENTIDIATTARLVRATEGLPFTFHRAFDSVRRKLRLEVGLVQFAGMRAGLQLHEVLVEVLVHVLGHDVGVVARYLANRPVQVSELDLRRIQLHATTRKTAHGNYTECVRT